MHKLSFFLYKYKPFNSLRLKGECAYIDKKMFPSKNRRFY